MTLGSLQFQISATVLSEGLISRKPVFQLTNHHQQLPRCQAASLGQAEDCFSSRHRGNGSRCQPLQMVRVIGNPNVRAPHSPPYKEPATAQPHRQTERSMSVRGAVPRVHTEQCEWVTATGLSTNICKTAICLLHCWPAFEWKWIALYC